MDKTTSQHTIQRLQDLFCRFGVPETIVTDNGPQFVSTEFKTFIKNLGRRNILSAAYYPSTNGSAERFVQSLKSALRKGRLQDSLELTVQTFLLTYRNAPHTTTKKNTCEFVLRQKTSYKTRCHQAFRWGKSRTSTVCPDLAAEGTNNDFQCE